MPELENNFALLKRIVEPVAKSLRSFQLSSKIYITFLYYNKNRDSFELVDLITTNPLYEMHSGISKSENAFIYSYRAIDTGRYVMGCDVAGDTSPWPLEIRKKAKELGIRSVISMPVKLADQNSTIGVINTFYSDVLVENMPKSDLLVAKCYLVSIAICELVENRRLREMEIRQEVHDRQLIRAKEIQKGLLPRLPRDFGEFDIAGKCQPAEEMSGDFFDYYVLSDDKLAFSLADATGHGGIAPALVVMQYHALFRIMVSQTQNLLTVANHMHRILTQTSPEDMFVTAFFGILSLSDHTLTFVNAAQSPIFHYRRSTNRFIELPVSGSMLGAPINLIFDAPKRPIEVNPGDILVLLTDGFWECHNKNNKLITRNRLKKVIRDNRNRSSKVIVTKLFGSAQEFANGTKQGDDQTALIIKRNLLSQS